ncbi:Lrp/AsnC family transcriptional regulator [Flavobacterium phragmitis]|jgi:DNA-binding Lrp family transcriptional regulator|uniref:Transcriptional regulator, AsnC family n=1 Tax=Flavobacterium phragmitis TaxID=739143 RepID=A0A1I1WXC5_9FLAO|nr:Lrp/AsnC family transcriptional regulator [Flavobacterium phragmitis]SFD97730.1 transcriptional regulator, AsnC family [Flavobacterium phragmitis]
MALDKFDLEILEILQKNNLTPQRDIGDRIGLSAAAVQRRIKRMRETGVITADVSVVDQSELGHPLTIFVEVELKDEQLKLIDEAKQLFSSIAEVQQCYYVTGDVDFILVLALPTMSDYEKLTRKLFFGNPNVKKFKTFVSMQSVKTTFEIPIIKK